MTNLPKNFIAYIVITIDMPMLTIPQKHVMYVVPSVIPLIWDNIEMDFVFVVNVGYMFWESKLWLHTILT